MSSPAPGGGFPRLRRASLVAFAAVATGVAFAASMSAASASLGAGRASTPRCTTAGLSVVQNLSGGNVASVTIASLPAACGGATLSVTVNNGTANAGGSATVPAAGGAVTVTLGSALAVATVEQTDLAIIGP